MKTAVLLLTVLTIMASGQTLTSVPYRYLYTFGSRQGIHPPKLLNRRAATAAIGQADNPYGLVYPVAVTTDQQGRAWITDNGTSSVHVFDTATNAYREIKSIGNLRFDKPSGIITDRGGRIYVVDSALGNVFVFDENGEFDRALIPLRSARLLEGPTAIALSEDGSTIFVADPPANSIVSLNREGEAVGRIHLPPEMRGATGLSVVNNQIYVMGDIEHRVEIFSPAGLLRGEMHWDGIRAPMAFAFDAANRLFLVGNPRLMVVEAISEDGQGMGAFGIAGEGVDQMKHVDALYLDAKGRVFVVDSHQGKVLVFAGNPPPPPRDSEEHGFTERSRTETGPDAGHGTQPQR